jgi:hypothetical protein
MRCTMLSPRLEAFFRALDAEVQFDGIRPSLDLIGAAAIELVVGHPRGTNDCDILEAWGHNEQVRSELERVGGKGTAFARRTGLYVDIVGNGVPFLPHPPEWLSVLGLQRFDVRALAPCDVAVSKLKRFAARDQEDIDALVEGGHVSHERFVERFRTAVEWAILDAGGERLPTIRDNFHEVELDFFGARTPTLIELPSWIDDD